MRQITLILPKHFEVNELYVQHWQVFLEPQLYFFVHRPIVLKKSELHPVKNKIICEIVIDIGLLRIFCTKSKIHYVNLFQIFVIFLGNPATLSDFHSFDAFKTIGVSLFMIRRLRFWTFIWKYCKKAIQKTTKKTTHQLIFFLYTEKTILLG